MKRLIALLSCSVVLAFCAHAAPSERVFAVNIGDDSVSLVDLATLREVKRFDVGRSPYGVAVTRDGETVAVGVEGEGKVKFYDVRNFAFKAEVRIGPMHHDHIVLSPDGRQILVANFHSDSVVLIDPVAMQERAPAPFATASAPKHPWSNADQPPQRPAQDHSDAGHIGEQEGTEAKNDELIRNRRRRNGQKGRHAHGLMFPHPHRRPLLDEPQSVALGGVRGISSRESLVSRQWQQLPSGVARSRNATSLRVSSSQSARRKHRRL